MILVRFGGNKRCHALARCIKFHFAHIVAAIFTWKIPFTTAKDLRKEIRVIEDTAGLVRKTTHFIRRQVNVFFAIAACAFG